MEERHAFNNELFPKRYCPLDNLYLRASSPALFRLVSFDALYAFQSALGK